MKKVSLILFVIMSFSGLLVAQTPPKFKVTNEGVKPVVIAFDNSYTDSIIYTRVKEWISINNKSPKSVTKVDNKNLLVKFSCYKEKAWHLKNAGIDLWNDLAYTLTVEIKTGKCRVTFATDETRYKVWYNADGTLKKNFKESESTFENTINETLTSLYNHIKGEKKKAKDEW